MFSNWIKSKLALCAIFATLSLGASVERSPEPAQLAPSQKAFHPVSTGPYSLVYNASVGRANLWYINDHTFFQEANGTWHLFGITHKEPGDPLNEHVLAHATAPELMGPWTTQPFALAVNKTYGETVLWAPYVIEVNSTYYMFYCGGGTDFGSYAINMATSKDLYHWKRRPEGPLFHDGYQGRDPMVTRINNQWVIYYCGTSDPDSVDVGRDVVLYRTSDDLQNWSDRKIAYKDTTLNKVAGVTESPWVYQYDGLWYLFIGPRPSQQVYIGTDVLVSDNPFHFEVDDRVRHIGSHALELIPTKNDGYYVSHCGDGQGGVYLAKLYWN